MKGSHFDRYFWAFLLGSLCGKLVGYDPLVDFAIIAVFYVFMRWAVAGGSNDD